MWWKEKLLKQQFSKCYDHGCLQNFLLHFTSLLTVPIVKYSHLLAGIYFIFLKERPGPNSNTSQYELWTSVKRFSDFATLFCNLAALTLDWNCVRLKSYQSCQMNQVWRGLGQGRSKKPFPEISTDKVFKKNSSFHVK